MAKCNFFHISALPLPESSEISRFVSKLEPSDIHARFGRMPVTADVASLIIPKGPGFHTVWAWEEGALVGNALLVELDDRQCELALLVRSDRKGHRIGTMLTLRSFASALELGANNVIAHVRADNIAALKLLRSTGFRSLGGMALEMWFSASPQVSKLFGAAHEIAAIRD